MVWILAGGFVTQASILIHPFRNTSTNFHTAYWYTVWAAVVTWTLIGLFLLFIILGVVGIGTLFATGAGEAGVAEAGAAEGGAASETSSLQSLNLAQLQGSLRQGIPWFTILFLLFALTLVIITGILASIAASNLAKTPNYSSKDSLIVKAYDDCVIAAVISLIAAGILFVGALLYYIIRYIQAEKIKAARRAALLKQQAQMAQVQELKEKVIQDQIALQYGKKTDSPVIKITSVEGKPV